MVMNGLGTQEIEYSKDLSKESIKQELGDYSPWVYSSLLTPFLYGLWMKNALYFKGL